VLASIITIIIQYLYSALKSCNGYRGAVVVQKFTFAISSPDEFLF